MPNDPTGPAAEGMPSFSRRQAIKSLAGGAIVGLTGAAIVATPTEAPAEARDPLLEALNFLEAENVAAYAIDDDQEFDVAHTARIDPLLLRLKDETPPATSAAGALAALRFVQEGMERGETICDEALLKAAMAFLEGRA